MSKRGMQNANQHFMHFVYYSFGRVSDPQSPYGSESPLLLPCVIICISILYLWCIIDYDRTPHQVGSSIDSEQEGWYYTVKAIVRMLESFRFLHMQVLSNISYYKKKYFAWRLMPSILSLRMNMKYVYESFHSKIIKFKLNFGSLYKSEFTMGILWLTARGQTL